MIDPQELFWSFAEYGKDYASGNDPIPEFNSKMNESQFFLFDLLSTEYDRNERIRIILEPFTRMAPATSDASGVVTFPPGFHRFTGGRYVQGGRTYPLYYAKENEIIMSDFIPQRKASTADGVVYYTYVNDTIKLTPAAPLNFDMFYLVRPSEAKLVYDYSISPDSYVQLGAATVDLEWSRDAYNLILSVLLMKYSLITRDQFKAEIASFGINSDAINKP